MTSGSSGASAPDLSGEEDAAADVAERLRFEALLNDLSAGFLNLQPGQGGPAVRDCLGCIVGAVGRDRSTLHQRSGDDLVGTHSWAAPGFARVLKLGRAEFPWAFEQLMAGNSIAFSRLDDLPAEASGETEQFKRVGLKSNATIPLIAGGKVLGA